MLKEPSAPSRTCYTSDLSLSHTDHAWYGDLLQQVIFTYNYGREHSTLKMTPNEARKPANEQKVEKQLAKHALHDRTYPPIKVGDPASGPSNAIP